MSNERKPRVYKNTRKLQQIRAVMDEFESVPDGAHSLQSALNYIADIADVMDENPAAQEAAQ